MWLLQLVALFENTRHSVASRSHANNDKYHFRALVCLEKNKLILFIRIHIFDTVTKNFIAMKIKKKTGRIIKDLKHCMSFEKI